MRLVWWGMQEVRSPDFDMPKVETGLFCVEIPLMKVLEEKRKIEQTMWNDFRRKPRWYEGSSQEIITQHLALMVNQLISEESQ